MSINQTVKTITNATLSINRQQYSVTNVKIEKLGKVEIKPLTGENPQHPARFQLHGTLTTTPDLRRLIDVELPRVDLLDIDTGNKYVLSQAVVKYLRDNEIKITATHFR